jgi:hypothetical protein
MVGTATAKTLYLVANHHTRQFDAWNINPGGTVNYLNTYGIHHSDPAGIACWVPKLSPTWPSAYPAYIFITSEFSSGVEIVNASTFTYVGTSSGPSDLAGVAVDHDNDIVYAMDRGTSTLYIYQWNPASASLTSLGTQSLPGTSWGMGIAFDEANDTLWVADANAGVARAYDANTWAQVNSFTPSHKPVDITVDRERGIVYTVSMSWGAWVPGGCGSYLLSKYDLASNTETTQNFGISKQGVGVAVDEVTGYVYVTHQYALTAWDPSTSPFTKIQQVGVSGSAAGVCVPKEEVEPPTCLRITDLDDGLAAGECVSPGDTINYQVSWSNHNPPLNCGPASNATLVATLAPETIFVSATDGGNHDGSPTGGTITWDIGNVPADDPGDTYQFVVQVEPSTPPSPPPITTYCTIDSDDSNPATSSVQTDICCRVADLWMVEYRWSTDPAHQPPYTMTVNPDGSVTLDAYMEARIENQGSGDAGYVTATISSAPGYVTIIDGDLTFGDVPAGTTDWSDDDYHITLVCRGPTDDQISWDIEYDDECGNHHVITRPEFPPAPPLADVLPQLKRLWIPEPVVTKLYPNYPNPFNPETWIPYQVAKNADVTVRIFDIRGQLIKTINLGHKEADFYISKGKAAYWDGRNQWGERVSSGVYFYTLHAGEFTATRRMVIMK